MTDIILEVSRAIVVAVIIISLYRVRNNNNISNIDGWQHIVIGFVLVFFGVLIDITDNFQGLNKFIIVGETEAQSFLEKIVGYLLGFMMLAYGISKWLPKLVELSVLKEKQLEVSKERLKVLRATMRTVSDIVNNFLNTVQYFRVKAEQENALSPKLLEKLDSEVKVTSEKLTMLGNLDSTPEKKIAGGTGIDYM